MIQKEVKQYEIEFLQDVGEKLMTLKVQQFSWHHRLQIMLVEPYLLLMADGWGDNFKRILNAIKKTCKFYRFFLLHLFEKS
jgi:hypothetical protein